MVMSSFLLTRKNISTRGKGQFSDIRRGKHPFFCPRQDFSSLRIFGIFSEMFSPYGTDFSLKRYQTFGQTYVIRKAFRSMN